MYVYTVPKCVFSNIILFLILITPHYCSAVRTFTQNHTRKYEMEQLWIRIHTRWVVNMKWGPASHYLNRIPGSVFVSSTLWYTKMTDGVIYEMDSVSLCHNIYTRNTLSSVAIAYTHTRSIRATTQNNIFSVSETPVTLAHAPFHNIEPVLPKYI